LVGERVNPAEGAAVRRALGKTAYKIEIATGFGQNKSDSEKDAILQIQKDAAKGF